MRRGRYRVKMNLKRRMVGDAKCKFVEKIREKEGGARAERTWSIQGTVITNY